MSQKVQKRADDAAGGAVAFTAAVPSFQFTAAQIEKNCTEEIARFEASAERVAKIAPAEATFANTVLELEFSSTELANRLNPPLFLKYVSTDAEVRRAADACEMQLSQKMVEIFAREDLYRAVRTVDESKAAKKLSKVERRLLTEYVQNFERNGLKLSPEEKAKFLEKKKRLVVLESEFAKNLVEWNDTLEVTAEELEGMPASYLERLKKSPSGKYIVTLAYPDYFPLMENAKNPLTRQRMEEKFFNKGGDTNRKLLEEALRLRQETARLLGYESHAEFVLEKRMAKSPAKVLAFLKKLRTKLVKRGKADLKALLEAKRQDLGDAKIAKFESYDWRYYENWIKKHKYQIDTESIREYFPLPQVVAGMFEIYETLLGVKFVPEPGVDTWHASVQRYRIERKGKPVAYFFADLFPRDGKYGHAAAFTLVSGYQKRDGIYELPVSAIVANFNPGQPGKPGLLDHGEVETLFHEFGHIMHQTLTTARFGAFSGTSVLRDFVECPSQMLENWVWDAKALKKLSGHYTDATKKLPKNHLDNLLKLKLLDVGLKYLRQLSFAWIDMEFHSSDEGNTTERYRKLTEEIFLLPVPKNTLPQAGFGHIMGGYDAGYYGYLWSEVYAQDLFTRFEKEGLLNKKTGREYAEWILEPGGEREPSELIRGFLGRAPNEKAFLKSLGL